MQTEFKVYGSMIINIFDIEEFRNLKEESHNNYYRNYYSILYFENNNKKDNSLKVEHIIFVPKGKNMQFQLPLFIIGKVLIFKEEDLYKHGREILLFDECSLYSNNYFVKNDRKFIELKKSFMRIISVIQKHKYINREIVQNCITDILLIKKLNK